MDWETLRQRSGPVALAVLLGVGLGLALWQPLGPPELLALGQRVAEIPGVVAAVLVAMAVLFVFALPGSLGIWLIAPFHSLPVAVVLLLGGFLPGAVGAWALAGRLGQGPARDNPRSRRVTALLAERSDFLTLCALRILPGFPHSVINYACGVLHVPLTRFIAASLAGLAVKLSVYAAAIHAGVEAIEEGERMDPLWLMPLVILALLLLISVALHRALSHAGDD